MQHKGFTFKYYNLEENNPYRENDENAAMWWDGEKLFYENIADEYDGDAFISRIQEWYNEAKTNKELSGIHIDPKLTERNHLLVFYLDLWHGRWFPFEDFNVIKDY